MQETHTDSWIEMLRGVFREEILQCEDMIRGIESTPGRPLDGTIKEHLSIAIARVQYLRLLLKVPVPTYEGKQN